MASNSASGPESVSEILADDDAVDAMPARKVKEAYVKMKLFEVAHEDYLTAKYGRNSMNNDEYDELMQYLEDYGPQGVRVALRAFSGTAFGTNFVGNYATKGNVVPAVFDAMTDTSMSEETRIAVIRGKIKEALRGCGMPRQKIARAVVQDFKAQKEGSA